jgi:hypothetical protein
MFTWLKKNYPKVKKIALSHPGDGGGENRRKHLEPIANDLGMKIVSSAVSGPARPWTSRLREKGPGLQGSRRVTCSPTPGPITWVPRSRPSESRWGSRPHAISTDSEIVSEVLAVSGPKLTEGYAAASWEMAEPGT